MSETTYDADPSDKVIAPYKISAAKARMLAQSSKAYADLAARAKGDFAPIDFITCPTSCAKDDCGYRMRVGNHSRLQRMVQGTGGPGSVMIGWLYVDAIDGTVKDAP